MSDEPQAQPPQTGTASHTQIPVRGSWLAAALANPAQTIALLGVLLLGGAEGIDLIRGDRPTAADVDTEIARREAAALQAAQIANAAKDAQACLEAVAALEAKLGVASQDAQARGDEQLAFTGEVAQYLQRLAEKLTPTPPETGPRLDEYVRKALMRGYRTQEDR